MRGLVNPVVDPVRVPDVLPLHAAKVEFRDFSPFDGDRLKKGVFRFLRDIVRHVRTLEAERGALAGELIRAADTAHHVDDVDFREFDVVLTEPEIGE